MRPTAIESNAIAALRRSWPGAFRNERTPGGFREAAVAAAEELSAGRTGPIDRLFAEIGSDRPRLTWTPTEADLESPVLAFLHRYWQAHRAGGALPLSREIDAVKLVPALGYLMLMEPIDGGADFRYRVYGSHIVDYSKLEMTGKCVWDNPAPWVATYFAATYLAVYSRREPLFTFHRARLDHHFAQWERLILPFVNEDGAVDRLLVGNIPSLNR